MSATQPAPQLENPPAEAPPPGGILAVVGAVAAVLLGLGALVYSLNRAPPPVAEVVPTVTVQGDQVLLTRDAPQWKFVELQTAAEAPALPPLPVPGHVDLDEKRSASVGTPLQGRVERVLVRLGDRVKAGDKLFSMRSGAWADLDRDFTSARNAVEVKQRLAERVRSLVELKAAPDKDALVAEAELKDAQLAFKAAEAKRASLRVSAEGDNLFWVTAPRAGTVVDLDLTANQEATPDREKPLLRISDLGEVAVLADVQESDVYDLKVGSAVTVHTQSGNVTRPGTIERISEVVDPKRRTVELRIAVANEDRALRPNAFVQVELQTDASVKRVRIPSEALVSEGSTANVFVERSAGHLQRVPVQPGRQRDGQVELRGGLPAGSRYVAKGAILLTNQIDLAD